MKNEKGLRVIKGDRRIAEERAIKVLMSPAATSEELDAAVEALKPRGQLQLIGEKKSKKISNMKGKSNE